MLEGIIEELGRYGRIEELAADRFMEDGGIFELYSLIKINNISFSLLNDFFILISHI